MKIIVKSVLLGLLIAAICVVLYWWLFAPIVSLLVIPKHDVTYRGMEYYDNGQYLNLENGKDFQNMLDSFQIPEDYEIVDFYYTDNYFMDNPIYGKMPDIYALDVVYPPEQYAEMEAMIIESCANYSERDDYRLYAMPYESSPGELFYIVGFCEKDSVVRFVMVTEHNGDMVSFADIFSLRSTLKFRAKNQDN